MIRADLTLGEFFATIYRPLRPDLSTSAAAEVNRSIKQLEDFAGDRLPLDELRDGIVNRWLAAYARAHSPVTVNGKRRDVLAVWRLAYIKGYAPIGPRDISRRKEPQRVPVAWTIDEVSRLLDLSSRLVGFVGRWPSRHWWPALELTIYWSGARISSALALEPSDWHPGERYFIARKTKNRREKLYWVHEQAVEAVAKILDPQATRVFTWPYHPRWLWIQFRRIAEEAGLEPSKRGRDLFHRLRRTTLSYCAASDLRLAQRQADHSSLELTRACYIDPRIARERSAVDVLPVPQFKAA